MTKDHAQQQAQTIHVPAHNNALNAVHLHDLHLNEIYGATGPAQQLVQIIHVRVHNVEKQMKNM
eukprot:196762-Prorocentrum_lima.AAC.1